MIPTTNALLICGVFLCGLRTSVVSQHGHCNGNRCFALFKHPKDFQGAQKSCKETGGQMLMYSSKDITTILTTLPSGLGGSYWLHSTLRATNEAAAQMPLQNCSSVSISMGSNFTVLWKPCREHLNGYLCQYTLTDPCSGLQAAGDAQVRYTAYMGFEVKDSNAFPPGTIAETRNVGAKYPDSKYVCASSDWSPAPWTCEVLGGGCEYKCNSSNTCMCPAEQTLHQNKFTCTTDPFVTNPCADCAQECQKEADDYVCKCNDGYRLARDKKNCEDVNECEGENPCKGNFTGRFWIGLHRTNGCPDAAAELRGFQWVTKDNQSDFSNWTPSFDSSCSSHRCVSVSREDNFKWIQMPCDEHLVGFLCEYSFSDPCISLVVPDGESVTYRTPLGFGGEDLLSLPPGSTAVRMPAETKYVCFSEQWLQAPWSCEIQEGGCEYKCAVDPQNNPSCYCPVGKTVSPDNKVTCEEIPEDPCLPLRCAHACFKTGDSYACMCDHGFKLAQDGRSCVDFNDCTDERQCPGENFVCVNTVGGFQCVCKDGYKMTDGVCVDVNECVSAPCEHLCINTPGGYNCSCYDGYKEDPKSPNRCKLHCGKEECVAECDPNDKFQCYCPEGYIAEERDSGTVCIDIDECSFFYCDHGCKNTFGSYVCSCSPGYTLVNEYSCVKNEDGTVTNGGAEVSGTTTIPNIFSTSLVPFPDPTRQPSAVSAGGLVGIIVCTVFFVVLVVFLIHYVLNGRGKMESAGALRDSEEEAHGLRHVKSDT